MINTTGLSQYAIISALEYVSARAERLPRKLGLLAQRGIVPVMDREGA